MSKFTKSLKIWAFFTLLCVAMIFTSQYTFASEIIFRFDSAYGKIKGLATVLEENTVLTIPYQIDGVTVKTLMLFKCDESTSHYSYIVGLDLSEATGLKTISKLTFLNCANLGGSITLPDGFEEVGDEAFSGTKIETVYIENIYYDGENMMSVSPTAFPDTTNFVFKNETQREEFISQNSTNSEWTNLEERCKYRLHLIAVNGTDRIDTEIEIMYSANIGEKFDNLMSTLKSTLGDDFVGLSQNGTLITKDTSITSDTLKCEFKTIAHSSTSRSFEYGSTATLTVETEGEYVWKSGEENLSESASYTLPILNVGNYTYVCEVYENGSLKQTETIEVEITPAHTQITFNTEAKTYSGNKIEIGFTSDKFSTEYFELTYYTLDSESGLYNEISEVINAGSYKCEINVKSEFSDNIIIDNDTMYGFVVDKYHLVANWGFDNSVSYATIKTSTINPLSEYATTELLKLNATTNTYEKAVVGIGHWKAVVTLKAEYEQNYVIVNAEKYFEVTATYVKITWVGADSYEYDESEKQITYSITGAEDVEAHTTEDSVLRATDSGVYKIKLVIDNPNILPDETSTLVFNWTITPKTLTVKWIDSYMEYNGEAQAPIAYIEKSSIRIVVSGAMTDANDGNSAYTATATLETPNPNYVLDNNTFQFVISKRIENIELLEKQITKDYDGEYILPNYTYNGDMPVKFYLNNVETLKGVKDIGEYSLEIRINETRNVRGYSDFCYIRILPTSLKSEAGNVTVEVDGKQGFDINTNLTIDEIHNDKNFTLANVSNGGKLALAKMIKVSIDGDPEEIPSFKGIKFKIKNINTDGLRIFSVTPDGLVECEYKIENGYICIANAGTGTFAFLTQKPMWFQSVGVWVLSFACGLAVLAIVVVAIVKRPINEKLEKQVVKAMSKAYEEQYQEHLEQQKALEEKEIKEEKSDNVNTIDPDDEEMTTDEDDISEEDDFNNFHDND